MMSPGLGRRGLLVFSLALAGAENLAGKPLVDISNPLNETYSELVTPPGTSGRTCRAGLA